ncbi:DUF3800 domain-containing protein [Rhizobium sp. CB3090]|uniref:DUF3800 domain-containing protein n=1 Tax=Rhizobium sp. CB3090 TaxID=3039156 RepID=UPI0024B200D8|nr:DUF3800 domain-containing protein [Rhizobium sp. CB3090]WFU08800.1 DUF3800 domain-containing protein [Rhizobium sp. CB3090]
MTIKIQAFFDESGTHDGSQILGIAGYIFRKSEAIKLGHEWKKVLKLKNLPYFHMVDCAHGNGPFANLTRQERIEVETKIIEIVRKRSIQGFAVTVVESEFKQALEDFPQIKEIYGSAYSFSVHLILAGVLAWIGANPRAGEISYFFESGHSSASKANSVMNELFHHKRQEYRYLRHGFVEKARSPAVQAADLLAWQWCKDKKNQMENRPRRKDCEALLKQRVNAIHLGRKELIEMRSAAALSGAFGQPSARV